MRSPQASSLSVHRDNFPAVNANHASRDARTRPTSSEKTDVQFSVLQALTSASMTLLEVSVSFPVNSSPATSAPAMLLQAARCCVRR